MGRVQIMGHGFRPDFGAAAIPVTAKQIYASTLIDSLIWRMKDGVVEPLIYGRFPVPADYTNNPKINIVWNSTVITGNVAWQFEYNSVGGNNTELLSNSSVQGFPNGAFAASSASGRRKYSTINLTASDFLADDTCEWRLFRLVNDASDTMVGDAFLYDLIFEYT